MMLKFISFTEESIHKILNIRTFQSSDFEDAKRFIDFLKSGNKEEIAFILSQNGIKFNYIKEGLIFTSYSEEFQTNKNTLTIDFEFPSDFSTGQILTSIFKLFRFSVKYWGNFSRNSNEYIIPNSTKAIIFPFSMSSKAYRIAVEREPNHRRLEKRFTGKHLLAYKISYTEGNGIKEECSYTNFNKAISYLSNRDNYNIEKDSNTIKPIEVVNNVNLGLGESLLTNTSQIIGHNNPIELLSDLQKKFVTSDINIPSRIEGPAGSGKTICLVLRALYALKNFERKKFLFICPSEEMVSTVTYFFEVFSNSLNIPYNNHIEIKTLQMVCRKLLDGNINDDEFLHSDGRESKSSQLLNIATIVEELRKEGLSKHKDLISPELFNIFEKDDIFSVSESLMHEIGILIKGRCSGELDEYLKVKRPTYALPTKKEADRRFIFNTVYKKYEENLTNLAQYDVDDISLSAIGILDTPVWKRRRKNDGYDAVFLDETHLFNFNELSIIHFLTKESSKIAITYAIDISQSSGDIAWDDESFESIIKIDKTTLLDNKLHAIFRCRPEITELAYCITAHGATLFNNFNNPISYNSHIYQDERVIMPLYFLKKMDNNEDLFIETLNLAENLKDNFRLKRHNIAIVFFDRISFHDAIDYYKANNNHISTLYKRGDINLIRDAEKSSNFIVGLAENIGGLEFDAVILTGIDDGRFPLVDKNTSPALKMFYEYVAHNQLYVSITRARKYVWILGDSNRGKSDILEAAIEAKKIDIVN